MVKEEGRESRGKVGGTVVGKFRTWTGPWLASPL